MLTYSRNEAAIECNYKPLYFVGFVVRQLQQHQQQQLYFLFSGMSTKSTQWQPLLFINSSKHTQWGKSPIMQQAATAPVAPPLKNRLGRLFLAGISKQLQNRPVAMWETEREREKEHENKIKPSRNRHVHVVLGSWTTPSTANNDAFVCFCFLFEFTWS